MTSKTNRTPDQTLRHLFNTTTRTSVKRILDTWNSATDADKAAGATWYQAAREHAETISESSGLTVETAAAVIAHLSPRTRWARNIAGAYALTETGNAPGCIGANVNRARGAIAATHPLATLHGAKTFAFAMNILGDTQAVTVDVWAAKIATGASPAVNERGLSRVGGYQAVAHAYKIAARRAGVDPAVMQAVTWIVARNGRAG